VLSGLVPSAPWGAEDRIAVITSAGQEISYAALSRGASTAADSLRSRGVRPRSAVAIAARAPAGYLVAALGALRAGALVVPCDSRGPPEAVSRTAARAGAAAVVVGASAGGALDVAEPGAWQPREHHPDGALLLSTSGSSAEPKLVLLSAAGVAANIQAILDYLPVTSAPRTAVVVPLSYSYGLVGQVLTALEAGATLLLLGDLPFAAEQVGRMRALGAEGLSTVPSSLRMLARAALDDGGALPLAYVASAGAPLDAGTVALVREGFPGARLFNQYGLTEASPRVTALSDAEPAFARGSVGRALRGLEIFAIDPEGAPLAADAEGELAVKGPNVMLGYLDDPGASALALLPGGALRTGDRGRVDAEGYVYVTGRDDGVVKVSGERVSVEEVSAALREAAGVEDAAVVAIGHAELGARLVGFVVGTEAALTAARDLARRTLVPAKRPARLLRIDALPRTANGKIAVGELRRLAEEET
jgi:long-chain acyl-CoA synthetase